MNTSPVAAAQHTGAVSRPDPAAPGALRLGFGGILRSEWIKLLSLRSIRITLIVTVLAGFGLSTLLAFSWTHDLGTVPDEALPGYLLMVSTFATPFLSLIFGVLGVFAMSSEYSSGMILSTLAAVPKRSPMFVAKGLVLALVAAVTALVIVAGGTVIGLALLPQAVAGIATSTYLTGVLGTVAYLVLIALFAFGIAGITRSTAGGIAIVVGVVFVLPIGFQVMAAFGWEWVPTVMSYLPMSLGNTMSQGLVETTASPGFGLAFAAMAVWTALPLVLAAVLLQRRDAK